VTGFLNASLDSSKLVALERVSLFELHAAKHTTKAAPSMTQQLRGMRCRWCIGWSKCMQNVSLPAQFLSQLAHEGDNEQDYEG
jgi:hypothetical protein